MKKALFGFVTVIAFGGLNHSVCGAEAASAAFMTDLDRLQGRWTAAAGSQKKLIVDLEIREGKVEVLIKTPQGISMRAQGEVRLNETTSPRSLDWVGFSGIDDQEIPTIYGIYKVESDSFTICNGSFNGKRPGRFEPGDGALADVIVFARVPQKIDARSSAGGERKDPSRMSNPSIPPVPQIPLKPIAALPDKKTEVLRSH